MVILSNINKYHIFGYMFYQIGFKLITIHSLQYIAFHTFVALK